MKRYIKQIVTLALLVSLGTGCQESFDDLYVNPNKPTDVPASLLFNQVLNTMLESPGGQLDRTNQYQLQNNSYFGNNQYNFGAGSQLYGTLTNVVNMEKQATVSGAADLNPYHALGKFFRAYYFTKMSLETGDIPMSEALQGATALMPKYDSQKTVFQNSLTMLEEANADLTQLIAKNDARLSEWELLFVRVLKQVLDRTLG